MHRNLLVYQPDITKKTRRIYPSTRVSFLKKIIVSSAWEKTHILKVKMTSHHQSHHLIGRLPDQKISSPTTMNRAVGKVSQTKELHLMHWFADLKSKFSGFLFRMKQRRLCVYHDKKVT